MFYASANPQTSVALPVGRGRADSKLAAPTASTPRIDAFNRLEWSVVVLARGDRLATLSDPGRFTKAVGKFFGLETSTKLANERLEALRRISVLAWHYGFSLPSNEIDRFTAAGFTRYQYEIMQAGIAQDRGSTN